MKKLLFVFLVLFSTSVLAQTDVTSKITNPSFEQDVNGWVNDGMARQSNTVFKKKAGTYYMEKWTARGGRAGNASIMQTVKNLPAGTYTLTVAAQNIQEDTPTAVQAGVSVFADENETSISVINDYTVQATIVNGTLKVGFVIDGATGNYVCVDNFRLTQEVPTEATYTAMHKMMQKYVDEVNAVDKKMDTPEQKELDAAREAVVALIAKNTTEGVAEAVQRLDNAIYDYKLSVGEQMNMTSAIVNPSFEKGGLDGWVNEGMMTQTGGTFTHDGNTFAEAWTDHGKSIGDVTLSQMVSVPSGQYTMTAMAQNIQQGSNNKACNGAFLFAFDDKVEVGAMKTYSLDFVVLEGKVNIGFMTRSSDGNWVSVDNFTLTYKGRSDEILLDALAKHIGKAEAIAQQHMMQATLVALNTAIGNAKAQTSKTGIEAVATALRESMEKAQASVDAYVALSQAISDAEKVYSASANGANAFRAAIDKAMKNYEDANMDNDKVAEQEKELRNAILMFRIQNSTGAAPVVKTSEFIARGATGALGRSTVTGTNIVERGFCWSTNPEPTILDERTTFYYNNNGPLYLMQPLNPATVYYVRAYAITSGYAVGYGEVRKVITLPMGNSTYSYNNGGSAAENERIDNALKDCIYYYNNWSATTNFRISCSYGSGTPTADCSYGGSMRVGPNASYQRTGTILHESNHGVGVGTSSRWSDKNLHDGQWKGYRANSLLQFIENNTTSVMAGDGMHMWPYGINGAHEDTGSPLLYIANVMITQALHEDGLVPPNHGGCKPAYVFEQDDDKKYYITSESDTYGAGKAFLTESSTGVLSWSTAEGGAVNDDAYAWYFTFDPAQQLYRIRNAKSGRYFTYSGGLKTVTKATPSTSEFFHLMVARTTKYLGTDGLGMEKRAFWIMAGNDVFTPSALTAVADGKISTANFNIADNASNQRWFILTEKEAEKLETGGMEISKEKLQRYLKGGAALLEVGHEDVTEGNSSNFESVLTEYEGKAETLTTVPEMVDAIAALRTEIVTFLAGTTLTSLENPFDLTFLLEAADMNSTEGWEFGGGTEPTLNNGIGEYFQKSFDMNQTLSMMPKGAYVFGVNAFQRPGTYTDVYNEWMGGASATTAKIYSGIRETKLPNIMDGAADEALGAGKEQKVGSLYIPDDMEAAAAYLESGRYYTDVVLNVQRKSGEFNVGMSNTSVVAADWCAFDNFKLYYYGTSSTYQQITGIQELIMDNDGKEMDVYDLQGRRVKNPGRGLYIIGGKKILK